MSPDPIGPVDGLNIYLFLNGNPVGSVDVNGNCKKNGKTRYEKGNSFSKNRGSRSRSRSGEKVTKRKLNYEDNNDTDIYSRTEEGEKKNKEQKKQLESAAESIPNYVGNDLALKHGDKVLKKIGGEDSYDPTLLALDHAINALRFDIKVEKDHKKLPGLLRRHEALVSAYAKKEKIIAEEQPETLKGEESFDNIGSYIGKLQKSNSQKFKRINYMLADVDGTAYLAHSGKDNYISDKLTGVTYKGKGITVVPYGEGEIATDKKGNPRTDKQGKPKITYHSEKNFLDYLEANKISSSKLTIYSVQPFCHSNDYISILVVNN